MIIPQYGWIPLFTVQEEVTASLDLQTPTSLLSMYEWATGLKTGSTGLAKCCLSATANKDGIDLIAVIMAATGLKDTIC